MCVNKKNKYKFYIETYVYAVCVCFIIIIISVNHRKRKKKKNRTCNKQNIHEIHVEKSRNKKTRKNQAIHT